MSHFFHAMLDVTFPSEGATTLSKARKSADAQLAVRIKDPNLRAWLLMNVAALDDGIIGWRNNVQGIYDSFRESIARFPDAGLKQAAMPTLFVGGADSDYLPVSDHPDIMDLFPRATFRYVSGAGHWVHSQKPQEFLELVLGFLEEEQS